MNHHENPTYTAAMALLAQDAGQAPCCSFGSDPDEWMPYAAALAAVHVEHGSEMPEVIDWAAGVIVNTGDVEGYAIMEQIRSEFPEMAPPDYWPEDWAARAAYYNETGWQPAYPEDFIHAYREAMLWTANGPDGHDPPEYDAVPEWIENEIARDAWEFRREHAELIDAAKEMPGYDDAQAGHDYALTRNRHGTGFCDRGLPKDVADALTNAALADGERTVMIPADPADFDNWGYE